MSNDQPHESDQSPIDDGLSEAERLAKLLEAAHDGEEGINEEGSLLSLPDELVSAEQDGSLDNGSLIDDALDTTDETTDEESLTLPDSISAEEPKGSELGPSWVNDADSTPLLIADDDNGDTLRESIQSSIETMDEEAVEETPSTIDLPPQEIRAAVEALLLVASKPMTEARLAGCLPGATEAYLRGLLEGLEARYDREYRGWDLRRLAGGWQLLTRPALHPWVRQLDKHELPTKLSKSAMETLAIVAYKQPVARGDIEDIRGVQCGPMLRQLMDLKLVQVVGRNDDAVGRPLLYGTTPIFLDRFGLGDLSDLPRQHEFGE